MKFQLVKTQAKEFTLKTEEKNSSNTQQELSISSLGVSLRLPELEETKSFAICFHLTATATIIEELINLDCEYWAFFEAETPLTQEFLEGSFTTINAPAIAYPYLRSFVTSLLANAGYPAMYLPTVNFVELAKQSN